MYDFSFVLNKTKVTQATQWPKTRKYNIRSSLKEYHSKPDKNEWV